MKQLQKFMMFCMVFAGVFMMITPQQAIADGTVSGTSITNQATLNYEVGGVGQTPITSDPIPTSFVVDNKVDLTVAEVGGAYTDVNPNTTDQVLTFTVTNTGNTVQDFALAAAAGANPLTPPRGQFRCKQCPCLCRGWDAPRSLQYH